MSVEMKMPVNFEKVNENDLSELLWWSAHLGIGPEKLVCVINKVGNAVADIRKYNWTKIEQPVR